MKCRQRCGACCIYPSISSPIPGMPEGKPAGVRCINLDNNMKCTIFDSPERPVVCSGFKPEKLVCGDLAEEAYYILAQLEGIEV